MAKKTESEEEKPLKALIEEAGYNQKTFAKAINKAYSTVKYYVSGEVMPTGDVIADMCRVLKKPPKEVFKALKIDLTGIPDDGLTNNDQ